MSVSFVSCSNDDIVLDESGEVAGDVKYSLEVNPTDADISFGEIGKASTRAAVDASDGCKYLYVVVFDEDDAISQTKCYSTESGAGSDYVTTGVNSVELSLARNKTHKIAVLASGTKGELDDDGNVSFESLRDNTYWNITSVTVDKDAPSSATGSITLGRNVASVVVKSNDSYPNAVNMEFVYGSRCTKVSMLTGDGIKTPESTTITGSNLSLFKADGDKTVPTYTFVSNEWTASATHSGFSNLGTITMSLKDGENLVGYMTKADVPVMRNRKTIISGNLFSQASPLSVKIEKEWGEDATLTW